MNGSHQSLEVTWGRAVSIWWAITWRALLMALLGGAVAGFVLGFLSAIIGPGQESIAAPANIIGFFFGLFSWLFMMKYVFSKKRFKDFHIALLPVEENR